MYQREKLGRERYDLALADRFLHDAQAVIVVSARVVFYGVIGRVLVRLIAADQSGNGAVIVRRSLALCRDPVLQLRGQHPAAGRSGVLGRLVEPNGRRGVSRASELTFAATQ